MLNKGLTLSEIAEQRNLAEGTIIAHVEKLLKEEPDLDISSLALDHSRMQAIEDAFRTARTWALGLVKERLGEAYSYDEVRLARLFLARDQ